MSDCPHLGILTVSLSLGLMGTLIANALVHAQACTALSLLGGQGYEVRKWLVGNPGDLICSHPQVANLFKSISELVGQTATFIESESQPVVNP